MIDGYYKEYWSAERFSERPDSMRLRVNDPGMSLHPKFGSRPECGENGQTTIALDEDLSLLSGAELQLELWGGHPRSGPKGIALNGGPIREIPDGGTLEGHCVYGYPRIPVEIGELYNGRNSLQFSIGRGGGDWGHCIVDNAAIRVGLSELHPQVAAIAAGARDPTVAIDGEPDELPERTILRLSIPERFASLVDRVDYIARYEGYDDNGSGTGQTWHGRCFGRRISGHLGASDSWPFRIEWDTSLVPDQETGVELAAIVTYVHGLRYRTPSRGPLPLCGERRSVRLLRPRDMPRPFWSRAGREMTCSIDLDAPPGDIETASLHLRIWDGGGGKTKDPFTINGHDYPILSGLAVHDFIYAVRGIDPSHLREGSNELRLLSDTEHHGIEVLLPGPAFLIRSSGGRRGRPR